MVKTRVTLTFCTKPNDVKLVTTRSLFLNLHG